MNSLTRIIVLIGLAILVASGCDLDSDSNSTAGDTATPPAPNILLVILDDAGVDQFEAFGYGGILTPPAVMPTVDTIADAGVRFRNTWSMPTCSPGRASLVTGRYPFRTGVMNAITSNDLANSQLSPYSLTTPDLLEEKGYVSALIGKLHVTGSAVNPDNNPLGNSAMRDLGWDYFAGYHDGGPLPIDTTAGGVAPEGTYECGFVPTVLADNDNGANSGFCYLPDGSHKEMSQSGGFSTPGRTCVEQGGIFASPALPVGHDGSGGWSSIPPQHRKSMAFNASAL